MPHLNSPTRVPLPISASCISPILKITSPFHRKFNFNTLIKAQTKDSEHPDQESKYPIQPLLNNPYSKDGADNFTTTRSLEAARPSMLLSLSFNLREKVLYLELMGVDSTKALRDNPSVLHASLYSIKAVVGYLRQMGILYKDMRKIFGMCPQILTLNIKKDLVPVFSFLIDEVNIPRKEIRKSISSCPKLLVCSVEEQLRPTLCYLKKLGCVIDCSSTVLLVSSVEKSFVPKLEYLQSLGFSYKDAVKMVVRAPNIFRASVETNLQPKIDFLTNEMGRKVEDLLDFPQYFGFSLEKRIKPRHMLLVKYNVSLTLSDMLIQNDRAFLRRLKQLAR